MAHIYILTNQYHTTLYIGVTANLDRRLFQHRTDASPKSFVTTYKCYTCIYIEEYPTIQEAIAREKQLKKWGREAKVKLITQTNPAWQELMPHIAMSPKE